MFEEIKNGLVTKMSWAFRVSEDSYDRDTRTRTILKIAKVYDVSAVSIPANADTDISARSLFRRSDRKGTAGAAGTPEETFENQTNDGGLTQ
ncbi:MAG: HK97 family phage prohead protease [Oscillospiraceae bacterium]